MAVAAMIESMMSLLEMGQGSVDITAPAGVLLFGLLTGLSHSMEADHLAAVSTVVASRGKGLKRASTVGMLWGLGHTASLMLAGLFVLIFAVSIPAEVGAKIEFGVGIMLVFLAVTSLTGSKLGRFLKGMLNRDTEHIHAHLHGSSMHAHPHSHKGEHVHSHKSFIIGMMHGLAGSGAVMLAVLSTLQSIPLGFAYIAIFGAGSIASMVGASTLIGIPFSKLNSGRLGLLLRYVVAIITMIVGASLMYDLAVVEHVFNQ